MRHSLKLFLFALLTGVLMASCSDDAPTGSDPETDGTAEWEEYTQVPVNDELSVKISRPTYVFSGKYTGEGKALVDRVTQQSDLGSDDLEVAIIPGSAISSLTTEQQLQLLDVIYKPNGTIVFVEPKLSEVDAFCKDIANLSIEWGSVINDECVERIVAWADETPFTQMVTDGEEDQFEIIALSSQTIFLSFNDREGIPETETLTILYNTSENDDELVLAEGELEVEYDGTYTDYYFGLKADVLSEWINEDEPTLEELNAEAAMARANIRRQAGNDSSLQDLVKSQRIILNGSLDIKFKDRTINHPYKIQYDVWAAYSIDKKVDYYLVKQSITSYNDKLGCGPGENNKWYNAKGFAPWDALQKSTSSFWQRLVFDLQPDLFGPYMRYMETEVSLDGLTPNVDKYYPMNNTAGGINKTESFSYSIGANAGFGGGKPTGILTGNLTWGTSVSSFSPDLKMTMTEDKGKLKWTYTGPHVEAHYKVFARNQHDSPRSIQTSTCTVEHAWVWSVATQAENINLSTKYKLEDEWLSYAPEKFRTLDVYFPNKEEKTFKSVISCPPRNTQEWSMTVTPTNTAVESYLKEHLKDYFIPNFKLYTRKPTHAKDDTKDEISAFVAKSKDIFSKNQNIMKQAAENGKISSYTIRWHNVNVQGSDADFTYEFKQ